MQFNNALLNYTNKAAATHESFIGASLLLSCDLSSPHEQAVWSWFSLFRFGAALVLLVYTSKQAEDVDRMCQC